MQDKLVFNELTADWKGKENFIEESDRQGKIYFNPVQNVSQFKSIALTIAKLAKTNLLICAFDSVGYKYFQRAFEKYAYRIFPVTSTVPSTSMSAWTSIFRGTTPAVHGIYGTAFFNAEFGKTVSLLSHRFDEDIINKDGSHASWISNEAGNTLFNELSLLGYRSLFYGLGKELTELSFFRQITEGSEIIDMPNADYLEYQLNEYVNYLVSAIEKTAERQESFCCVAFMSFARYVADYGYTHHTADVLKTFAKKINILKNRFSDLTVLSVADHGMIRQQPLLNVPLIHDPEILKLSQHHPGGAGRILFFYPKQDYFLALWNLLQNKIGNTGKLYSRIEYIDSFYNENVRFQERIGDIVAIAETEQFPSAGIQDAYEHGGLTKNEMIAFISLI